MNDKNAFEKWWKSLKQPFGGCRKGYKKGAKDGWQAACEYKQKEIDELEAENAKLKQKISNVWKEAEEFYLDD